MAGEFMVINPRGKRRKRTKAKARRRKRRAVAVHHNKRRRPARRRRAVARRRRAVHSNPRFAGIDVGAAAMTAGGIVGVNIASGYVAKMLPASWQTPIGRIGVKVALGVGAPLLLKRFIGSRTANLIAAGAAISVLLDAYGMWVAPALGLSDYDIGMTGYESNPGLSGGDDMGMSLSGHGDSIYSDTIY